MNRERYISMLKEYWDDDEERKNYMRRAEVMILDEKSEPQRPVADNGKSLAAVKLIELVMERLGLTTAMRTSVGYDSDAQTYYLAVLITDPDGVAVGSKRIDSVTQVWELVDSFK